ncbi:MAG: YggS family pyridoxal phosphate-dependent enzyme, partial [Coriobacteriales bacterium]|nr:YggS family pyridoxal phosphate-dependent enzyme [Coriobacteriales bacterium]
VKIVAVSKTVGEPEILEAIAAGIVNFGENRTALFKERAAAFPQQDWHFIGTIQTNKIKDFAGRAALVHSVASERALKAIDARLMAQPVLIEVNVSGEESKDGVSPDELEALLTTATQCEHCTVEGLMTMAPIADAETIRATFRALRELRDTLAPRFAGSINVRLRELSMGMSDDYAIAVEEGATIIRIGRALWA